MPTPAQIDEQIAHEREAIRCGIDKLYKDTQKLTEREYASASVYGVASISAAQKSVADVILKTFSNLQQRKNGQYFADIMSHLSQFNDEKQAHILANIALKRTFDLVFSQKRKDSNKFPNAVSNVAVSIGASVEDECQIRWYEEQDPELLQKVQRKYWLNTTGTQQKRNVAQLMFNREEIRWPSWGAPLRARLGAWLLGLVCDTTGWFTKELSYHGKPKLTLIVPTPAYDAIQEQLLSEAVLFAPMSWPMLIEPNDWTNDHAGGYLLNELNRMNDLVRKGNNTIRQPETPLRFLNKLQRIPYVVNQFTYGVAKELNEMGRKVGKFKPLSYATHWEMPTPPPDIDTNEEARFQYRKAKTEAENKKRAYIRSMHVRTTITMETAERFGTRKFYHPWSFDYRGRAYPIPAFLSIQDTDFGKSLIRFYEEAYVTPESEDWLAFQVATTYGLDKAPIKERLEWSRANHHLITLIACDPIRYLHLWEEADEPWQFLAACDEYYHCLLKCDRTHTSLPIAVDATCSGLQILAGLARDKSTATLVNVVPGDKPADAYKTVAEAMTPLLHEEDQWLAEHIDRSVTKRSVMTIPYNATEDSSSKYIREALKEKGVEVDGKIGYRLAKCLREAMTLVAPGPLEVMKWIKEEMGKAITRGCGVIQWQTPSGFIVHQKRNAYKVEILNLRLLGRTKFHVVSGETGPSKRKHQSCGAPNLIHSLDASLLHLAFQRFDAPFSVIHDSVLCRATDMSILSAMVRETYMYLFADNDYLTDFAQQIGAETEPPIIGTLEPESVIESTYFFC
jgi:DNA-directed RNA polymerase